jgi:hypothetical protein
VAAAVSLGGYMLNVILEQAEKAIRKIIDEVQKATDSPWEIKPHIDMKVGYAWRAVPNAFGYKDQFEAFIVAKAKGQTDGQMLANCVNITGREYEDGTGNAKLLRRLADIYLKGPNAMIAMEEGTEFPHDTEVLNVHT